jgi:hypothetical protein
MPPVGYVNSSNSYGNSVSCCPVDASNSTMLVNSPDYNYANKYQPYNI